MYEAGGRMCIVKTLTLSLARLSTLDISGNEILSLLVAACSRHHQQSSVTRVPDWVVNVVPVLSQRDLFFVFIDCMCPSPRDKVALT